MEKILLKYVESIYKRLLKDYRKRLNMLVEWIASGSLPETNKKALLGF